MSSSQCVGVTVKGVRCRKAAQKASKFCNIHQIQDPAGRNPSPARSVRHATPTASVPEERQPARIRSECKVTLANGQRCRRQTAAKNHCCFEHQPRPTAPSRSVSFSSPLPGRSRTPARSPSSPRASASASARILASFAVEELQAEILRRVPMRMRSASASVADNTDTASSEDEDESVYYYC